MNEENLTPRSRPVPLSNLQRNSIKKIITDNSNNNNINNNIGENNNQIPTKVKVKIKVDKRTNLEKSTEILNNPVPIKSPYIPPRSSGGMNNNLRNSSNNSKTNNDNVIEEKPNVYNNSSQSNSPLRPPPIPEKPIHLGSRTSSQFIEENIGNNHPPPRPNQTLSPLSKKVYAEALESSNWEDMEEGYMEFEMGERFLILENLEGKHKVKSTKTDEEGLVPSSKISILSSDINPNQFQRGRKNTTFQNLQMFQNKINPNTNKPLPVNPNTLNTTNTNSNNDNINSGGISGELVVVKHMELSDLMESDIGQDMRRRASILESITIFGKKLSEVMKGSVIPMIAETIFQTLTKTDAIGKLSDLFITTKDDIRDLKNKVAFGEYKCLMPDKCKDPHLLISVLYHWIETLEDPLVTSELKLWFLQAEEIEDDWFFFTNIHSLVHCLPLENRILLKFLFSHFCKSKFFVNGDKKKIEKFCGVFSKIILQLKGPELKLYNKDVGVKTIMLFLEKYEIMFNNSMTNIKFDNTEKVYSRKETTGTGILNTSDDDSSHVVTQGNLEQILFKVMDKYYTDIIDSDYIPMLISTHEYFVSHNRFLTWIIEKYLVLSDGKREWHKSARKKLLETLRDWFLDISKTNTVEEICDKEFATAWKLFTPRIKEGTEAASLVNYLVNLNFDKFSNNVKRQDLSNNKTSMMKNKKMGTNRGSSRKRPTESDNDELFKAPTKELANAITFECSTLFRNIRPTELLFKNWEDPNRSKQFASLVEKFNRYQSWAATQIMVRDKLPARVEAYEKVVKIASFCVKLNNFHAGFAFYAALNLPAITRQKKMIEKLSKKTMEKFKELEVLFSPSFNHKNYQNKLHACNTACIPYIGMYTKHLFTIEELNKTMLTSNNDDPQYIIWNVHKMRMLYLIIKEIKEYQQRDAYVINVDLNLLTQLSVDKLTVWDNNELYQKSFEFVPKK
eukprot:TRINITY_DN8088_c0_g1_i1.p1 TRINITY_DN8088_c0_g1~~TRINITY_DN8088_c0_g1_i1.p1  ORF type:complete len:960 (-),score=275.77 TRINITY_DN8088_c0_g1_i1:74-2953(-)